ncbi:small multi-drug export protein [Candidatus Woesearchaeota archaeon]|jgi:uncharacterized membrane protein|nr:small multi-drug export protein [Candidatus Woesearchaeota archaeon]MBT3537646.1 small multi-drug export protein [Candidatus Woesearchaeota archaeon]MBT4698420.1 small multi-drug export protein [Candidatus Woesearchaeota archaeon]MBT4716671.1 small multi-drug export protein [Candidatus Woesearchaeota archaeon]MBT7105315.1 small multi-drug export protein [Candidatus Woesearchaeota archaeon]
MNEFIELILITLLPFLELRASIPYGFIATELPWYVVSIVCILTNMILGPVIYLILDKLVIIFTKIQFIDKIYKKIVARTQKRIEKAVDKWGEIGVAIFIGIPLPGSGVYSGALGSYLIGLNFKKFLIANIIGVLIAGVLVTAIMLSGTTALDLFIKTL